MKKVQVPRWNTADSDAFIGPSGMITADVQRKELRLHDGSTPGGVRIPNYEAIVGFGAQEFTSIATAGVPGPLGAVVGKLVTITAAGSYQLPTLAGRSPGDRVVVRATVAAVTLQPNAGDYISDIGVDVTGVSLDQFRILTLVVMDTTRWLVVSKY